MLLYSTTGGKWTYPVRITYSIVPDGTSIGRSRGPELLAGHAFQVTGARSDPGREARSTRPR